MISGTRAIATIILILVCSAVGAVARGSDDVKELLAEARSTVIAGRTNEAIALYKRVVARFPSDTESRRELARLLIRRSETRNEAEKYYAEIVALAPNDSKLAIERAANLAGIGENVKAALEYRRAFELAPNDDSALTGYITQINYLGATPVAIQRARENLATVSGDVVTRLILAALLHSEARYDDALDQYSIARSAAPEDSVAIRGAAESWLALGYIKSAEEMFALLAQQESSGRALCDRARALLASDQPEEAVSLLTSKMTDVSREPLALIALSDAYHALNRLASERTVLEKLASAQSENGPVSDQDVAVLERLARVRFEMGDLKGASAICDQLLSLVPGNPVGNFGLELIGRQPPKQIIATTTDTSTARQFGSDQTTAVAAMFWNQPARALQLLRSALKLRGDSPRLQMDLGSTLLKTRDAEGAAGAFAQIAISNGQRPDAILGMAEAEMLRNNPRGALSFYSFALQKINENARALVGQAEALMVIGQHERAAVVLGGLAHRFPYTDHYKKRFQEALTALGRTFRLYPMTGDIVRVSDLNRPRTRTNAYQGALIEPVLTSGDELRVRVTGHPELSAEVVIDEDALIRLPFLESAIQAGCLTERELTSSLIRSGGAKFVGLKVEIEISEYQRLSLVVGGAVYLPGRFNVRKSLDLREALMLASGVKPTAGNVVYIVRGQSSCEEQNGLPSATVESYDRTAAEAGRITLKEPLRAGDTVLVTEAQTAFVIGEASRSSLVETGNGLTLLDAVQRIGGVLTDVQRSNIRLHRLRPDGITRQIFNVNLNNIEQQNEGRIILLPDDVVEIPSARGKGMAGTFAVLVQRAARSDRSLASESKPETGSTDDKARLEIYGKKP